MYCIRYKNKNGVKKMIELIKIQNRFNISEIRDKIGSYNFTIFCTVVKCQENKIYKIDYPSKFIELIPKNELSEYFIHIDYDGMIEEFLDQQDYKIIQGKKFISFGRKN